MYFWGKFRETAQLFFPPFTATKSSVKNLTDIMGSGSTAVGHRETRDSKLRYLGRMSPEEQVDKYLKSVEKEARFRQKLRQKAEALESHTGINFLLKFQKFREILMLIYFSRL